MARVIRFRRPERQADPVSVNAHLSRLSNDDLYTFVETSLMNAGYHLSQWRQQRGDHLSEARQHLRWAMEGADELERRHTAALPP